MIHPEQEEDQLLDETDDDQLHQTEGFEPENEKDIISGTEKRYNLRLEKMQILTKLLCLKLQVMKKLLC